MECTASAEAPKLRTALHRNPAADAARLGPVTHELIRSTLSCSSAVLRWPDCGCLLLLCLFIVLFRHKSVLQARS
ncbi:hypothetical protein CCH79_00008859 [Gambusia affinis]|uniref:Uncharacterized protein n=1 Tax=Gambusia affinis TaxID=33528 RepID=A0A315UU26_GAMAF|nr:hypothetical protein CCH79_00008859 [Gambusia affinis]